MTDTSNSFIGNKLPTFYLLSDIVSASSFQLHPSQNNPYPAQGSPASSWKGGPNMFVISSILQSLSGKTPDKSSDSVTKQINPDFSQAICDSVSATTADSSTTVVPSPVEVKSLPLEWVLGRHEREHEQTSVDRTLEYLARQEMREINPHLRDDLRQAQITLILAQRGNTEPFVVASYTMYGVHPDKVWSSIQAMRHAKLGSEYSSFYDAAGNDRPDIPKKSVASSAEGFTDNREQAAKKSGKSELAGNLSAYKSVEYSADFSSPTPGKKVG